MLNMESNINSKLLGLSLKHLSSCLIWNLKLTNLPLNSLMSRLKLKK